MQPSGTRSRSERTEADTLERAREQAARLRETDEMEETILQAVSHDLRTPIAAILGLATTLEREDLELSPEDARDMVTRIVANARRLDRIVSDLLDLDRLSRGVTEPTFARADVGALVTRVVAGSEISAERSIEVDAEPVEAEVDTAKVERIVEDLLANADRHAPGDSPIRVSASAEGEDVVIAVDDDGPSVPEAHRAHIFEPFRRGPEGREHTLDVGVRLALVAGFAELHGGRAWVQDGEAGGASFRVRLPAETAAAAPKPSD
ncbi:MAG TPA: ATP-binding protein [Actinomycetota bacterium]|nr:ATP-binding protein [Actinomycetota bacterium]